VTTAAASSALKDKLVDLTPLATGLQITGLGVPGTSPRSSAAPTTVSGPYMRWRHGSASSGRSSQSRRRSR
jgi:hypothetical protein